MGRFRNANLIRSVLYSILWCIIIWVILPSNVPPYVFLILFFWFIQTRLTTERYRELRRMVEMNNELLIEVLSRDPNFDINDFMDIDDDDDE